MGKAIRLVLITFALLVFGQQCARVDLEHFEEIYLPSESSNPFRITPPTEFPVVRRYVLLVDMSNSMISGPCQNDVNAGILFSETPVYSPYDPSKGVGNANDHRADGIDCVVNEQLGINRSSISTAFPNILARPPIFYQTHPGIDFSGHRIEIVKKWLTDLLNESSVDMVNNTKVMIIPVSGGLSQQKLLEGMVREVGLKQVYEFLNLSDPKVQAVVGWLQKEHNKNYELARSSDVFRYDSTTMGTTSPGAILSPVYDTVAKDMKSLNQQGLLSYADYDFVHLTDGIITPKTPIISKVLNFYSQCAYCAANKNSCTGICSTLVGKMEKAWGKPEDSDLKQIDFKLSMLQSLPQFYGAGNVRLNFVQMYKDRVRDAWPNELTFFGDLKNLFDVRESRFSLWEANSANPPFALLGSYKDTVSFKMTHLFLLNPNVRLSAQGELESDSDGDGLFDSQEARWGTDILKSRTNGYCLDSFMADGAYSNRCKAMAAARSCDPTLDSDGDSLSECEEMLLGTDAFDFDTDGDGIPDLYEWLYGYNPLSADSKIDSNGDGYINLYNFSRGLGPSADVQRLQADKVSEYEVNYLSKESSIGVNAAEVWVESYQVILRRMQVKELRPVDIDSVTPLYASRVSTDPEEQLRNRISEAEMLLSSSPQMRMNKLVGVMRLVDRDNPDRIFWRVYKTDIPVSNVIAQPQLDLSKFKLIRTRDRGQ